MQLFYLKAVFLNHEKVIGRALFVGAIDYGRYALAAAYALHCHLQVVWAYWYWAAFVQRL